MVRISRDSRTARNLRNSLEFPSVLCRGRPLKHNINRLIIGVNFAQFAEYVGELSEFCLICVHNGNEKFCCKFKRMSTVKLYHICSRKIWIIRMCTVKPYHICSQNIWIICRKASLPSPGEWTWVVA